MDAQSFSYKAEYNMKSFNIWYFSSFIISILVIFPVITVFTSFFQSTSAYFELLQNTFLYEYIYNSGALLLGVLSLTFIIGVGCAYLVSFYKFPGVDFFKWSLILGFAVPPLSLIHISEPTRLLSSSGSGVGV